MIQALWQKVNVSVRLEHKKVSTTIPDFTIMNQASRDQLTAILDTAGLERLRD